MSLTNTMEEDHLKSSSSTQPWLKIFPLRKLWPVFLCWLLMMVATAVAAYLLEFSSSVLVQCGVTGVFLGEFALAAIIGGLVGRTWIAGWLLSACLAILATLVCYCVDLYIAHRYIPPSDASRLVLCSFWPLLMLSACAPMIAMRGLRGWSLTLDEETAIPKQTSTVEDLLLLSLIVASCITIARWTEETMRNFEVAQSFFILGLFFGFSLLFALPATAITFRARNWAQRLTGWFVLTILALGACFGVTCLMSSSLSIWQDFVNVAVGVPAAVITMILGGVSLLISGVKMTHFATTLQSADFQLQDGDHERNETGERASIRSVKLQSRVLSGVVVACALVTVVAIQYLNLKNLRFFRDVQNYKEAFPDQITELTIRGDIVVGVTFVPETTNLSLERYRNSNSTLERLSFAGTKITDEVIDKLVYFPKLKHLDLSNTAVTNAGLEKLKKLSGLTTLSLANTKVDLELALQISKKLGVKELDVSATGIVDGDLNKDLLIYPDLSLKLSHNAVTDAGISELLKNPARLKKLDLSDTDIDGSGLVSPNCPSKLNLDRTKITDANLLQILNIGICSDVSIRSTSITAAILPIVVRFRALSLTLGEGNITEQDLINLPPGTSFKHLGLNSEKFTGDFMRNRKFDFNSLDLSNSGITDSALQNWVNLSYVYFVNLSNTNITDAGLATLSCQEVDVRNTKVTIEGIKKATQIGRILIDHNQFPAEELVKLRNTNAVIDGEKTDYGW